MVPAAQTKQTRGAAGVAPELANKVGWPQTLQMTGAAPAPGGTRFALAPTVEIVVKELERLKDLIIIQSPPHLAQNELQFIQVDRAVAVPVILVKCCPQDAHICAGLALWEKGGAR